MSVAVRLRSPKCVGGAVRTTVKMIDDEELLPEGV